MIQISNVHKSFGKLEVLKGIDLHVKKGEKLVIIGPSGSGKSTLICCMNGLEAVSSGTVKIDGQLMHQKDRARLNRQYSSMVFQQFKLYPHLSVMENLTLAPMKLKKVPKKDAEELAMENLKRVGLAHKANVYPTTLSGGQQQRIAIDDWFDYYNHDRYQWQLAKLSPSQFYSFVTTGVYPLPGKPPTAGGPRGSAP